MLLGLVDAQLGGGVVKKRVARAGQGKRGSYRTVLATIDLMRFLIQFGKDVEIRIASRSARRPRPGVRISHVV